MANLLRKVEPLAHQPEISTAPNKYNPLEHELLNNIEELSKEIHYLKEKTKILVSSQDKEELADTIYKLQDLRASVDDRKQRWEQIIRHMDISAQQETAKVLEMLKSTTEKLESLLQGAMTS